MNGSLDAAGSFAASVACAAIVGRLSPLLLGSKGRMFDCQRSMPTARYSVRCRAAWSR